MLELLNFIEIEGVVTKLLITESDAREPREPVGLNILREGIQGDRHFGIERTSTTREKKVVAKGTNIANLRQVSIISTDELRAIASNLGVEKILPEDLEANITISGIPNLTKLPLGSYMIFPNNAVLFVTEENIPCVVAGARVEKRLNKIGSGLASKFVKAAMHLRGVVAMCYTPGMVELGDKVKVYIPERFTYTYSPENWCGSWNLYLKTFEKMVASGTKRFSLSSPSTNKVLINLADGVLKYAISEEGSIFFGRYNSVEEFIAKCGEYTGTFLPIKLYKLSHDEMSQRFRSWEPVYDLLGWNGIC